jgi:hypothetical protein
MPEGPQARVAQARPWRLRPLLRALHRDAGYLGVGLTVVYAVSGIAVNHIESWDPSFDSYERMHRVEAKLEGDDAAIARSVLGELGIEGEPREVFRESDEQLDITFDDRTLHVTLASGEVLEQGQEPRFFLRAANYLHLNRGKRAWSYIADAYAVLLLYLAFSGMAMLSGRKGFWGRGIVLVALGAAVPIAYVALSP